ncbi:hypothetical protein [Moraxella sp. ZY200743]|uniref:hypothetical protein n=1 Tax=Moraxella sp. ZY200743 TaxID=2911970 RepID=UPI003D7D3BA5
MSKIKRLITVVMGLAISGSAVANEPVIGTSTSGFEWRVLHDRVKVSHREYFGGFSVDKKTITAWIRRVVVNDIEQDGLGMGDYYLTQVKIDCSDDTYKDLKDYKYKEYPNKGFVMVDSYEPRNPSYKEAVPESMVDAMVTYMCKNY